MTTEDTQQMLYRIAYVKAGETEVSHVNRIRSKENALVRALDEAAAGHRVISIDERPPEPEWSTIWESEAATLDAEGKVVDLMGALEDSVAAAKAEREAAGAAVDDATGEIVEIVE